MSDATIERDLAAVETALTAGAATHDDPIARELQELALELRADASRPDPAFAERLRERMEAGFPDERRARRKRGASGFGRRVLMPAAGVGVPLALIVGLIFALGGPDGTSTLSGGADDSGGGGAGAGGGSVEQAPRESATMQRQSGDRSFAPGQAARRIERTFSLELDVAPEEMTQVADRATQVTNRHGGFVLDSSVSSGRDEGGGDFSLRIPSERVRPALRDLAQLAPVIRQSQSGRDVTRRHVTVTDRLQAARAERRSLLRRLELADTDAEAEAIRRQLDLVAAEINGLRAQLRDLRLRTSYAVVNVSLLVAGDQDDNGGVGGSLDDALDDASGLMVGFAGVLIRVLALGIPLALIGLAAWLATRAVQRRLRESALA
jgi:hypothetical protein